MNLHATRPFLVMALVVSGSLLSGPLSAQQSDNQTAEMKAMMEQASKFTQPGKAHEVLNRFLGKWDVDTRFVMAGQKQDPETSTCEISWLIDGRWLKSEMKGSLMGQEHESFAIMGYDNFKKSYVTTSVQSLDTAMMRSEGDLDASGKVLTNYGTIDEYLTGEHDKIVKSVWRFVDDDNIVFEVHDLAIGEGNTMVIEQTFQRQK